MDTTINGRPVYPTGTEEPEGTGYLIDPSRIMPKWTLKLARRIMALKWGRYAIILTVGKETDWTVVELGKIELP